MSYFLMFICLVFFFVGSNPWLKFLISSTPETAAISVQGFDVLVPPGTWQKQKKFSLNNNYNSDNNSPRPQ